MIPFSSRQLYLAIDAHIRPNWISIGHLQPTRRKVKHVAFYPRDLSLAFTSCSLTRVRTSEALRVSIGEDDSPHGGYFVHGGGNIEPKGSTSMAYENYSESSVYKEQFTGKRQKEGPSRRKKLKELDEMERRRKISEANKGKVPWNKGRRHTVETREFIKKRTLEALRDPKVRRKMVECRRAHSDQSKARISLALKRAWERRLKWKFLQDKCCAEWRKSIAEAARVGGIEQQELKWNSFDKLKLEIAEKELQEKAKKEKAKEIVKQQRANDRVERKALMAQEQKMRKEQKGKAKADKKVQQKTEGKGSLLSKELVVMAKLPKVKKSTSTLANEYATHSVQPAFEKWDLEFVKKENMRRGVSLADQIRAVKLRKAQYAASENSNSTDDEIAGM